MSFRQFGGLQFASKHNAVASNYNTSNNLLVTQNVGQPNSYITFLSDISGNITLYGNLDVSGNVDVSGDVDISGNLHVQKNVDISGNLYVQKDALINGITVGAGSGNDNTNTTVGSFAFYRNTDGYSNTAIGGGSLYNNINGSDNTALGYASLNNNRNGNLNVAVGQLAFGFKKSGNFNTAVGGRAGIYDVSGNNNTFIGYQADVSNNFGTPYDIYNNSTGLGYQAIIDDSNQIVLGTSNERVKIPGSYVGINGVYNPSSGYNLDVNGNTNSYYIDLSSQGNYTSNPWGVVPKKYIDDRVQGLIPLAACQCGTTASVNLLAAPPSTIDGYTLQTGDRVLVNYQSGTTPSLTNGIYVVNLTTSPYWTYASDWTGDTYRSTVNVLSGLQNGNKQFIQIQEPGIVSVNPILFEIFSSSDQAGRGLSTDFSGNTLYLNVDTSLNFVNFLDNSAGPDNINVLNLGTNTNTINIGKVSAGNNKISVTTNSVGINNNNPSSSYNLDVSGNMRTTADALIHGLTVGRGGGNSDNSVIGFWSLQSNTSGYYNTAIGSVSLQNNTTGYENTAVGGGSLRQNISGNYNTAVGYNSLYFNTGNNNTAIGRWSLQNNTTGNNNTALGYSSLFSNNGTGSNNTAIGREAQHNTTTGGDNTSLGSVSLYSNTTGNFNVAIGREALRQNTTTSDNTAIGYYSLFNNTGGKNTAIGSNSGWHLNGNSNFNTFLGDHTDVPSGPLTYNYSTALGYNAIIDASNQIVLGGLNGVSYPSVKIPGSYVGIGGVYDLSNNYTLDVSGNARIALGSRASNLNPALTLSGGTSNSASAYLQLYGGGGVNSNVGINLDTFNRIKIGGTPATTIRSLDNGSYSGNLQFLTAPLGTIDASNNPQSVSMVINPQATGNAFVGIGTTTPAYTLDVNGNGRFNNSIIVSNGVNNSVIYESYRTLNLRTNEFDGDVRISNSTYNTFNFQFGFDSNGTSLSFNGTTDLAFIRWYSPDDISSYLQIGTADNAASSNVGEKIYFTQYDSGNNTVYARMRIDNWGVWINPSGDPNFSSAATYSLNVNGDVNATTYNTPSDYRIKENVTQLDDKFVVDNLNPVTYLNKKSDKQDIGLIAHELQEIFPELVNGEKDGEEFQSVNYIGLIPILIKEIQELKKEIKLVKIELNELKNK
jgi:hypothetical protein